MEQNSVLKQSFEKALEWGVKHCRGRDLEICENALLEFWEGRLVTPGSLPENIRQLIMNIYSQLKGYK